METKDLQRKQKGYKSFEKVTNKLKKSPNFGKIRGFFVHKLFTNFIKLITDAVWMKMSPPVPTRCHKATPYLLPASKASLLSVADLHPHPCKATAGASPCPTRYRKATPYLLPASKASRYSLRLFALRQKSTSLCEGGFIVVSPYGRTLLVCRRSIRIVGNTDPYTIVTDRSQWDNFPTFISNILKGYI